MMHLLEIEIAPADTEELAAFDRVAMVEEAERRGWLQPAGTIIEAPFRIVGDTLGILF